jgi:hypothetical protein
MTSKTDLDKISFSSSARIKFLSELDSAKMSILSILILLVFAGCNPLDLGQKNSTKGDNYLPGLNRSSKTTPFTYLWGFDTGSGYIYSSNVTEFSNGVFRLTAT